MHLNNKAYSEQYIEASLDQCTLCHHEGGPAPDSFISFTGAWTYIEANNSHFATQLGETYHGVGLCFEQSNIIDQRFLNLETRVVNHWVCL